MPAIKAGGLPGSGGNTKSFRYMRRQPTIVQYDLDDLNSANNNNNNDNGGTGGTGVQAISVHTPKSEVHFDVVVQDSMKMRRRNIGNRTGPKEMYEDGPGKKMMLKKPLEVWLY